MPASDPKYCDSVASEKGSIGQKLACVERSWVEVGAECLVKVSLTLAPVLPSQWLLGPSRLDLFASMHWGALA